jgi:hypothetical protein
VALEVVPPQ